ncbi:MAG: hypothetical protein R2854_06535 [Caldilineaceae bacterium]
MGLGVQHDKATMARAVLEGVGFRLGPNPRQPARAGGRHRRHPAHRRRRAQCALAADPGRHLRTPGPSAGTDRRGHELGKRPWPQAWPWTSDWSIAAARSRVVPVYEPGAGNVARYRELKELFRDSYLALAPIYARLARIAGR